jgi:hypothetical protein
MADMDMVSVLVTEDTDMVSVPAVSEDAELEVTEVTVSVPAVSEDVELEVTEDTDSVPAVSEVMEVGDSEDAVSVPVDWEELDATILTMLALFLLGTNATLIGDAEDSYIPDTETATSLT